MNLIHFANPKILWLLIILVVIVFLSYLRSSRSKKSALLRFISLALIILGLSDPFMTSLKTLSENEYLLLVDNSSSMTERAILDCFSQTEKVKKQKKENIIYFSDHLSPNNTNSRLYNLTDYEKAFSELANKYSGSDLVICTDGNETKGSYREIASQIKSSFSSISIIHPEINSLKSDPLQITNLSLPLTAQKTDNVFLSFTLKNTVDKTLSAKYEVVIDGERYKEISLSLAPQTDKKLEVPLTNLARGPHKVTIRNSSREDLEVSWITILEPPSLLVFSKKGEQSLLLEKILSNFNYDYKIVEPGSYDSSPKINKEDISGVIINNLKLSEISAEIQKSIESFISAGGSAMILGGDSSFSLGGYANSIIEKISPLKSVPPKPKIARAPSAVMMVLDKSGSMAEQGRLHAAKLAAMSAILSLKPDDYIGLVAFDGSPLSVIDFDTVEKVKTVARDRLASLTAYGETNLLPALSLARLRLSKVNAGKKHIILLSDGNIKISSDKTVHEINNMIRPAGITVSTVALGYEADVPHMKLLASAGKGSFYHVLDPKVLPKIFVDDIKVRVGEETMKEEGPYQVMQKSISPYISSLSPYPSVLGFVETEAKQGAATHFEVSRSNDKFPLLATWSYQGGKVMALSSDLQGRWTSPWLRWQNFSPFWSYYFQDIFEKQEKVDKKESFEVLYAVNSGRLILDTYIYDPLLESKITSSIGAIIKDSKNEKKFFPLDKKVKGRYQGAIEISEVGDYEIELNIDGQKKFKISVLARDLGEVPQGINFEFLSKMSKVFDASLASINFREKQDISIQEQDRSKPITFLLFCAALIVFVLEVFVRERLKL